MDDLPSVDTIPTRHRETYKPTSLMRCDTWRIQRRKILVIVSLLSGLAYPTFFSVAELTPVTSYDPWDDPLEMASEWRDTGKIGAQRRQTIRQLPYFQL